MQARQRLQPGLWPDVSERTDTIEARRAIVALRPWSVKSTGAPHDEFWDFSNRNDLDVSAGRAAVCACGWRLWHNFESFHRKAITQSDADPDHRCHFHSHADGSSDRHSDCDFDTYSDRYPDCDFNTYIDRHSDGNFNAYKDYDCDPDFKAYGDANFNPWQDCILGYRGND